MKRNQEVSDLTVTVGKGGHRTTISPSPVAAHCLSPDWRTAATCYLYLIWREDNSSALKSQICVQNLWEIVFIYTLGYSAMIVSCYTSTKPSYRHSYCCQVWKWSVRQLLLRTVLWNHQNAYTENKTLHGALAKPILWKLTCEEIKKRRFNLFVCSKTTSSAPWNEIKTHFWYSN